MTARPSPRLRQPYSPRCPSPLGLPPLGFPPLAPHMAFVNSPSMSGSLTPERHIYPRGPPETRVGGGGAGIGGGGGGGGNGGVPYPPEARRPLAGTQSRRRSQPVALAPLSLNNQYHPPTQPQQQQQQQKAETGTQRDGAREMEMTVSPPSPTPSDTSSLSLYSSDSVTKSFPVGVVQHPHLQKRGQQQEEEDERPPSLFCGCINLKAWFGGSSSRAKENRILGPPARPVPEPVPQTVQVGRRRPSPLNL